MLDASDQRYPPAIRVAHLNQSIQELGRQFETRLNEGVAQIEIAAATTSFDLNNVADMNGAQLTGEVLESLWYVESYTTGLSPDPNLWTNDEKFSSVALFPDYEMFMDTTGAFSDDSIGFSAVQRGRTVHLAGVPSGGCLARVVFRGPNVPLLNGSNSWLDLAPWCAIYHAAQTACVWLEDEVRIQVYEKLLVRSTEIVNIADSMRGDAPLVSTEV